MRQCAHDTSLTAGTWYLWRTGRRRVFLACPGCAGIVMIDLDDLNEDGTLTVPFQCRRTACGFRDEIQLSGWTAPIE